MAYAVGHISGGHLTAITIGALAAGRLKGGDVAPYGHLAGDRRRRRLILATIASGSGTDAVAGGLAANGFGDHSPGGYSQSTGLTHEVLMTFFFLLVILGSTSEDAPKGFAILRHRPRTTLIHLVSIPITNTSVNSARSTGPALLVWAIQQLWLFWVAPIVGVRWPADCGDAARESSTGSTVTGYTSAWRCPQIRMELPALG